MGQERGIPVFHTFTLHWRSSHLSWSLRAIRPTVVGGILGGYCQDPHPGVKEEAGGPAGEESSLPAFGGRVGTAGTAGGKAVFRWGNRGTELPRPWAMDREALCTARAVGL